MPARASSSSIPRNRNWTWDAEANAYFWHRFYPHQPDLNFDNPAVLRGGAVDHAVLARPRASTGCGSTRCRIWSSARAPTTRTCPRRTPCSSASAPKSTRHAPGRMLLAEANQWPEDAQQYFGDGDECHMAFHFPLMPRMYMAIAREDRFPITDIMRQTPEIPDNCQWAIFLRNHDELTLEMVTDRERDYLWETYATDRRARHQSRHPPPPRTAAGTRPAADRADERPAAVDARHAGDLLRRRDRDGRQHPPR